MNGPSRRVPCFVLAALTTLSTSAGGDVLRWPTSAVRPASDDLAPLRWSLSNSWVVSDPDRVAPYLARFQGLAAAHPTVAHYAAAEALALRLMRRFDEAGIALERARARDPHVLDDPDVALTAAYLEARQRHYASAVSLARQALPRVSAPVDARIEIALEIARWSMARGPDGLAEALDILRAAASVQVNRNQAMIDATMALVLLRLGRPDEAREVARSGPPPVFFRGVLATRPGELIPSETEAAVGVSRWLTGHPDAAQESLSNALVTSPEVWRASLREWLVQVHAAHSDPVEPSGRR